MQTKYLPIGLCSIIILFVAVACTHKSDWESDDARCVVTLLIANPSVVETRSTASERNVDISDGFVLLFDVNGKYVAGEKLDLSASIVEKSEQSLTVSLHLKPEVGQKVVFLMNSGLETLPTTLRTGISTLDEINERFPSSAWNLNKSDCLPMSGEGVWSAAENTITLYRSVANIQLTLSSEISDLTGSFTHDSDAVKWTLYNYPQRGNIYAAQGMFNPILSDRSEDYATSSDALTQRVVGAVSASDKQTNYYVTEHNNSTNARGKSVSSDVFDVNRMFVLVHTSAGYYRLDLLDPAASDRPTKFIDIKRNTTYKIVVKRVRRPGYATPADAIAMPGNNIEYELEETDDSDNIVVRAEKYALSLGRDTMVVVGSSTREFTLKARSVVDKGAAEPSVNSITASDGITILSGNRIGNTLGSNVRFRMNASAGSLFFKLGTITYEVKIERVVPESELKLFLSIGTTNYEPQGESGSSNYTIILPSGDEPVANISVPSDVTVTPSYNVTSWHEGVYKTFTFTNAAGKILRTLNCRWIRNNYFVMFVIGDPEYDLQSRGNTIDKIKGLITKTMALKSDNTLFFEPVSGLKINYTPSLVLCAGDLAANRGGGVSQFTSVFSEYYNNKIPCVTIYGNHDWDPYHWGEPSNFDGTDYGLNLTGRNSNIKTLNAVKESIDKSTPLGVSDVYYFSSKDFGHIYDDILPFSFKFRTIRFYCGQTFWFKQWYEPNASASNAFGLGNVRPANFYNTDELIKRLENQIGNGWKNDPAVWLQHYPLEEDEWWWSREGFDRGALKSERFTNVRSLYDQYKKMIRSTKNPTAFAGHDHRESHRTFTDESPAFNEYCAGYFPEGVLYVVLVKENSGVVEVRNVQLK